MYDTPAPPLPKDHPTLEHIGDIIFWSGAAVMLLGASLALWAFLWDWFRRTRPRIRRCPKCWYDMTGTPGRQCPECGRHARSEKTLLKSRRRWRWGAFATLMIAAGSVGVFPALQRIDWIAHSPSWLILASLKDPLLKAASWQTFTLYTLPPIPPVPGQPAPLTFQERLTREIWRRDALGLLSDHQCAKLAAMQMAANGGPIVLHTRKQWPAGQAAYFTIERRFAGVRSRELHATVRGKDASGLELRDNGGGLSAQTGDIERELFKSEVLAPGTTEIALDVKLFEEGILVYSGIVKTPIDTAAPLDQIMRPIPDESANRAVTEALANSLWMPPIRDAVILARPKIDVGSRGTVALKFQIMHAADSVAEADIVMTYSTPSPAPSGMFSYRDPQDREVWCGFKGTRPILLSDIDASDPSWYLLVTGDPTLALRDFDSDLYWQGQQRIPLANVRSSPDAPPLKAP